MSASYNEIEPFAAQWLRNLIAAGHIAPGDVDERSIEDISPDDLRGYIQCHFFAGIGVWSAALRGVGWPDDRPIWTASCPCQGFSAAGKGLGFADERHLWPALFHLVDVCRPARLVGEQVASPLGLAWLDLVHADLEGAGYTVGAVDTCAAGFGAPHIRQRLYWVADAPDNGQFRRRRRTGEEGDGRTTPRFELERLRAVDGLADAHHAVRGTNGAGRDQRDGPDAGWAESPGYLEGRGGVERLGFPNRYGSDTHTGNNGEVRSLSEAQRQPELGATLPGRPGRLDGLEHAHLLIPREEWQQRSRQLGGVGGDQGGGATLPDPGPLNGHWRAADWLGCRDGRWRPVEPGSRPLAHGLTGRVGRLRAYGNAINKAQAEAFLACLP